MRAAARKPSQVRLLWFAVGGCPVTTILGYAVTGTTSGELQGGIDGFTAGALLMMLIDSMVPEATHKAGDVADLLTNLGPAVAAV